MTAGSVVWRRSPGLALVESADRVVLVHLAHPERPARILEGSAATIWRVIDGKRDTECIVRKLAEQYGVAVTVVRDDVLDLIGRLAAEDFVERA